MSKEQIMNGADAPSTGSKAKEKDDVNQFPSQKVTGKVPKTTHRLLSYKEFVSDKFTKFNKDTIEKDAMDGEKKGDAGVATLDEPTKIKTDK
jgi:hypothetical protein